MAKSRQNHSPTGARRRSWRRAALVIVIAALAATAWFWSALGAKATVSAAYGARIACSCRFVAARPLAECGNDLLPGMGAVTLGEDKIAKSVTATYLLVASETAIWRKGQGCVLESWEGR